MIEPLFYVIAELFNDFPGRRGGRGEGVRGIYKYIFLSMELYTLPYHSISHVRTSIPQKSKLCPINFH